MTVVQTLLNLFIFALFRLKWRWWK